MDTFSRFGAMSPDDIFTHVKVAADIQRPSQADQPSTIDKPSNKKPHNGTGVNAAVAVLDKLGLLDRLVNLAGTNIVLFLMIAGLACWAILGGVLGPTQTWQIVMQNTSSIQCYISDTLLMRQQRNNSHDMLQFICEMRSRNLAVQTMAQCLLKSNHSQFGWKNCLDCQEHPSGVVIDEKKAIQHNVQIVDDAVHLPPDGLIDHVCDVFVAAVSSLYAPVIYWAGIVVWLIFGSKLEWGNDWQLYINTATAVELTFVSVFLQNTRQRHMNYLSKCFLAINEEQCHLERRMRELTRYEAPNPVVEFEYDYKRHTTWGERAIDYYATIVGTGVGLVLSAVVFAAWIIAGRRMSWNSNWWLIIGTYTGLIGFVDGFVLRNVYYRMNQVVDAEFNKFTEQDIRLCKMLGAESLCQGGEEITEKYSWEDRIANKFARVCAHSWAVLAAITALIVVIIIASVMKWSETGQLICNTSTMIIEGFLLLVLIQGHNLTNKQRRLRFQNTLKRHRIIQSQVEDLAAEMKAKGLSLSDLNRCSNDGTDGINVFHK